MIIHYYENYDIHVPTEYEEHIEQKLKANHFSSSGANLMVKFLGTFDTLAFEKGRIYEVISIEKGWYRIMTELDEDYLFPPEHFEIIGSNE